MIRRDIADSLEAFVRAQFAIAPADPRFTRDARLFELGYIDSVGVVELLAFIEETFRVTIGDEDLLSERFQTIDGIAELIEDLSLKGSGAPGPARSRW